ncbi:hypothetical protein QQF64_009937 [Cirrhinus molitorella]|uniref:Uncharacterized protein n=1 Tax=Cirrhinus molitorella TaxID=172907 RepID=A0ABR3M425_9TELE
MSRSDVENCNTTTSPLPFRSRSTSPPSHSFIFGLPEVSQGRASQCLCELTRGCCMAECTDKGIGVKP